MAILRYGHDGHSDFSRWLMLGSISDSNESLKGCFFHGTSVFSVIFYIKIIFEKQDYISYHLNMFRSVSKPDFRSHKTSHRTTSHSSFMFFFHSPSPKSFSYGWCPMVTIPTCVARCRSRGFLQVLSAGDRTGDRTGPDLGGRRKELKHGWSKWYVNTYKHMCIIVYIYIMYILCICICVYIYIYTHYISKPYWIPYETIYIYICWSHIKSMIPFHRRLYLQTLWLWELKKQSILPRKSTGQLHPRDTWIISNVISWRNFPAERKHTIALEDYYLLNTTICLWFHLKFPWCNIFQ